MCSDYVRLYEQLITGSKQADVEPLKSFAVSRLGFQRSRPQMIDDMHVPSVDSSLTSSVADIADLT
jgi:hypothetical protein